jgi:hypothetical protein
MRSPENYCPICGVRLGQSHRCDEKRIARIEAGRKAAITRGERKDEGLYDLKPVRRPPKIRPHTKCEVPADADWCRKCGEDIDGPHTCSPEALAEINRIKERGKDDIVAPAMDLDRLGNAIIHDWDNHDVVFSGDL